MGPKDRPLKSSAEKTWLLAAALPQELELLISRLAIAGDLGHRPCWRGILGIRQVVVLLTGLGLANAAQAVAAALERLPDICGIINLGCAGAFSKGGLGLGQAAVASGVVYADAGIMTRGGFQDLAALGIPLLPDAGQEPVFNRLPVDAALSAKLAQESVPTGLFATVSMVSGCPARAEEMFARWGAILEEMEGAAVAQVAALYQKPFAAVRGISNLAGGRHFDLKSGAEAAQRVVLAWAGSAVGETNS